MSRGNRGRSAGLQTAARKRLALRVLKLLEIGAGGKAIGQRAGEFVRRLGSCADFRRAILRYVNRRGVRGVGAPFKAIACAASDRDRNAA